jgi:hypothetical protein
MRKLEEVIREFYIEDLHLSQLDERYPIFLQIAATGLQELNHDLKSILTEVTLTVNDNDTVDLPNNYIDYKVIGVVNNGVLNSLGINDNMAPRPKDDCGNIENVITTDTQLDGSGFIYSTAHYTEDGQFSGRAFGIGGGGNDLGTYKVYKQEGYISLNGMSAEEIVLIYLATIEQVDGNFMVEEFLVDAIKSFIWHRYIRRMRSYGITEKKEAEAEFNKKKKLAMRRINRFSLPSFMNSYRSGYRSSPNL